MNFFETPIFLALNNDNFEVVELLLAKEEVNINEKSITDIVLLIAFYNIIALLHFNKILLISIQFHKSIINENI